jgi:hypothetical protein
LVVQAFAPSRVAFHGIYHEALSILLEVIRREIKSPSHALGQVGAGAMAIPNASREARKVRVADAHLARKGTKAQPALLEEAW